MGVGYSPNQVHNNAINAAELQRQNSVASATTQRQLDLAWIKFHRAVVASANANNNGCGVEPHITALRALGVTGL
jgi:hypothetical protein